MSDMKKENQVNKEHKDRLFNYIFGRPENREWTLSLYNAVNESHYTDASLIEFNTLKDVLYIGMRNDTSFLIVGTMNVYEHQSSYNPNMPLRQLEYVSKLFSGYISDHKLNKYGESVIKLPTPKLVVFYNGTKECPDEKFLYLSDSFEPVGVESDVEVKVRMLNINAGRNKKIMQACKPLAEYAWFIEQFRQKQKENADIVEAMNLVIKQMPADYQIRPFLVKHQAEVCGMLDTEYNEAEIKELFKEDGRREGRVEGRAEGRAEGRVEGSKQIVLSLLSKGKITDKDAAEELGITTEELAKLKLENGDCVLESK